MRLNDRPHEIVGIMSEAGGFPRQAEAWVPVAFTQAERADRSSEYLDVIGRVRDGVDVAKEAIIQGQVLKGGEPVDNAYVRLLDRTGEFTAEVPTSATGHFRFFAGPGEWTLRTLAPKAEPVDKSVTAATGVVAEVAIAI